jgi:hypothetical protein
MGLPEFCSELVEFFNALLDEKTAYRIVFDRETEPPPWCSYPAGIDFLENHVIIFERTGQDH